MISSLYNIYNDKAFWIPGHISVLQSLVSDPSPTQLSLEHWRDRVCCPPPQETLHVDHPPQSSHVPGFHVHNVTIVMWTGDYIDDIHTDFLVIWHFIQINSFWIKPSVWIPAQSNQVPV